MAQMATCNNSHIGQKLPQGRGTRPSRGPFFPNKKLKILFFQLRSWGKINLKQKIADFSNLIFVVTVRKPIINAVSALSFRESY